jgi:hypothetical protein
MKRLSKLLALVLTGVMALTLLAGCSGGVALSEKEILENFKDFYKVEVYPIEFTDDTTNYAQKAANAVKVYYNGLAEEEKAEFDVEELIDSIAEFNDPAGVCGAVVPNGSSVAFELYCATIENVRTPYFQKQMNYIVAQQLLYGAYAYLTPSANITDNVALSSQIETIGSDTYIFMVMRSISN